MPKPLTQDQLKLAKQASQGDAKARTQVNKLAEPIIRFQTDRFCKRFCRENRYRYHCTLIPPWTGAPADAALCEWGNASYGWMLDDLTGSKRLLKYQARNGASLFDYLYQIGNSQPFYERWKDWRFGRKVHVPSYIQDMGPTAASIFLGLRAQNELENIAQKLGRNLEEIKTICQQIIIVLTQKKRLHLLNPPTTVSLTENNDENDTTSDVKQLDIASFDESPEQREEKQHIQDAWKQLGAVEQFVLEALVIEEQDASHVLEALKTMRASIKKDVPANETNRQQLYYFRRKTLAKLAQLINNKAA